MGIGFLKVLNGRPSINLFMNIFFSVLLPNSSMKFTVLVGLKTTSALSQKSHPEALDPFLPSILNRAGVNLVRHTVLND